MAGKFDLKDMYDVWEKFAKPGLLKKFFGARPLGKMPGGNKLDESQLDQADEKLRLYRVILDFIGKYDYAVYIFIRTLKALGGRFELPSYF